MRQTKSLKRSNNPNYNILTPFSFKNNNPIHNSNINDPQQQIQIDHNKAYRLLYHSFTHNFYSFIKKHKNCLGDIQQTYKSKLPKQQYIIQQQKQKIFHKHFDKLKRQMHYRNSQIQKNINQYHLNYKLFFQIQDTIQPQTKNHKENQNIQIKQFSPKKLPYRPYSSSLNRNRPQTTIQSGSTRNVKENNFNLNKLNIQSQNQFYKSSNLQTNHYQSCSRTYNYKYQQPNKIKIFDRQPIIDFKQKSFYLHNQHIYISQRHTDQENNQAQNYQSQRSNSRGFKGFTPNFYPKSSRKQQQIKLNYRKILEDKQKQIIKNKIFMVNSALAVNLAKPQGYRPKSQIWQKLC